ncbi:hypothetical protein F0L74_01685 [Chitinophaga agrisoli]|uniref:Uncharacterized protein n=1 Tax=Chitinophaga agrisoli TaxID=2607653 RepID=A0A5B2VZ25_9BACT|nr:hypothetical protein [Chitinophaga agrisoli]KAA2244711.1 hypothetical protein F0L74_01685 [Chitinophaga agrisoli]
MESFLITVVILAFILLLAAVYSLCFSRPVNEPIQLWGSFNEYHREYVSVADIDPMQESRYYHQIKSILPKITYLLREYKIAYADVITSILKKKIPPAFLKKGIDGYIDWTLLKKYVVDCEAQWYNLKEEFKALCTDHQLANAVRSSFQVLNRHVKLTVDDLSNLRFDFAGRGHIRPVYANGEPLVIPRIIAKAGNYFGETLEDHMPEYKWQASDIAAAIRNEREQLDQKLSAILQLLGINSYMEIEVGQRLI